MTIKQYTIFILKAFASAIFILAAITSPAWFTDLLIPNNLPPDDISGIAVLLNLVYFAPILIIIGIVITVVSRKHKNWGYISLMGFLLPAVAVCSYIFISRPFF